ncbi:hypothetical protein [uncultured Clostridium sp.]|uniref:hypothetical protein n=1 Tax=uncultured Clostridium sp. TaxID=59620 RepID=UPI0025F82E59|nr:hypothetical protein [uncultured Clostridium sp.]
MKKSTLIVLIGGFVLLTALLGPVNQQKMYKKHKNFTSAEEVIQVLESRPILGVHDSKRGDLNETEDFLECLSLRKRLTTSDFHFSKIDVNDVIELDEKTEADLLNYYGSLRDKITKAPPVSRKEAVRLKVNTYYMSNYQTGEMEKNEVGGEYQLLDLVLIDEGEGFVIDFVNNFTNDYIPDYSKIDEFGNVYYDGKNDIKEYHDIDEDLSQTENNTDEEVG